MSERCLAEELGLRLSALGLTVCTAESCTGGLIADMITDVSGSSRYFAGGIIAYSNEVKRLVLAVPTSYLSAFGAVSAPVALAMAKGAARLFNCDIAIASTGIAGPTGGTADKPVGLVYLAIVAPGWAACQKRTWPYDRRGNKAASAYAAIALALSHLSGR